ncbi:hypothetical protein PVK06_044999 [Gossypium arboreum]|uniref:Zinc finger BED domain-containing protein RICESLEEPER 2-like n=1 Tax=Gossypium arboreum TaxID=29729 RepID=A0ABR0MVC4_GOSAR|nr:hypothetical protein PVK06_044999 [Gossypium arboreum]
MFTEPTSIEGSVTPPTSIDSENLRVGASKQVKGTTGKRKATPQRSEIQSHFTKIINSEGARINKLFTITIDNASSNDVAIGYLRKKFNPRGGLIQNGKYLHMRCMAHIVNFIVVEGLKEMNKSVERVKGAFRYARQSPAILQKFKECVVVEKIECKKMLCLDVCTRWNSTYLMFDTAQNFKRAFERFESKIQTLGLNLKGERVGLVWMIELMLET